MHDLADVRAAWRDQPVEDHGIDIQALRRRTRELHANTRAEIITSIAAALVFAAFLVWRFTPGQERLVLSGCAAVALWAAITMMRLRRDTRPAADAFARTGLHHYRDELRRRCNHLRSAWIWHGPLLLACVISAIAVSRQMTPGRFWQVLPMFLLLAVWAAFGIRQRLRQVAALQQEIDEIDTIGRTL